jgi:hypothetical protein
MPPTYLEPGQRRGAETGSGVLRFAAEDGREITVFLPDLQVVSLRQRLRLPPSTARLLAGFLFEPRSA